MRPLHLPLLLPLLVALLPVTSPACTCMPWPPPTEALERFDAVFTARILDVRPAEPLALAKDGTPGALVYTAQVLAVWKGGEDAVVTLVSDDPAMCGLCLDVGEEYLLYTLYADETPQACRVSSCFRWFPLAKAGPDLEELGDPIAVASESSSWSGVKALYH